MDLKTLQERLSCGLITTVSQFKRELDLIWDNCLAYNSAGHALSCIAVDARRAIDLAWNASQQPPRSHALDSLAHVSQRLDEMHNAASQIFRIEPRPIIAPVRIPKYVPRPPAPVAPPPKEDNVAPNRKQLKAIAETLSHTPAAEMKRAWELLTPYIDRDAATFSLSTLPESVLIALKRIVLQ
jgi:hypothetical protein